ncbi:MAG: hypothetical protein H0W65_02320 [Sphingomonas sp.]|uniref:DUF6058 family natural product biosynthesis protein n=1 Tax=Sphingomonas sp. TaxID=28214 RepID=UPI0017B407FE|nr:DUF6058 family natural product biosynthesis protein [Sphingomonas sp.]MBA3666544.1 hypothetical protein [Sphingomonas sp.]
MSTMRNYLDRYFREASVIAEGSGLSVDELDRLVAAGAVPAPSYTVLANRIVSAAFGDLPNDGVPAGRYFAPSQKQWLDRASGGASLEPAFREEMARALADADRTIHRLPDAFDEDGEPLPGLAARLDSMWGYFLDGVFALCVAESGSVRSIARKEVLQEKLSALCEGAEPLDREGLAPLIDQYASAAMPFSPAEYPHSSRKRLVSDLSQRLSLAD